MAPLALSEELLPVFVPIAVYWIGCAVYGLAGTMEKHRMFTDEEIDEKNLASRRQVLAGVLFNQLLQMAGVMFFVLLGVGSNKGDARDVDAAATVTARAAALLRVAGQLATALLFNDAWLYFWHRLTHENLFMYKHVHAMHHRMVAPYSYGALYMHPFDLFVGDTLGGGLAVMVAGLSPRSATVFITLLILKTLDDHSGLWFPNNPFHRFLTNNTAMHGVHHQLCGNRRNFSRYYFCVWDRILGTYLPYSIDRDDDDGGRYRLRAVAKYKTI